MSGAKKSRKRWSVFGDEPPFCEVVSAAIKKHTVEKVRETLGVRMPQLLRWQSGEETPVDYVRMGAEYKLMRLNGDIKQLRRKDEDANRLEQIASFAYGNLAMTSRYENATQEELDALRAMIRRMAGLED